MNGGPITFQTAVQCSMRCVPYCVPDLQMASTCHVTNCRYAGALNVLSAEMSVRLWVGGEHEYERFQNS